MTGFNLAGIVDAGSLSYQSLNGNEKKERQILSFKCFYILTRLYRILVWHWICPKLQERIYSQCVVLHVLVKWSCWGSVCSPFPEAHQSQKEHFLSNSVSQQCSSLFWDQSGNILWIFPSSSSWLVRRCVESDCFPSANTQLIADLLFQSCTERQCNYSAGGVQKRSAPPLLGVHISLSAAQRNRRGWEYQTGVRNRQIRAAAVHWRHAERSQVPWFHKNGSITWSSLVSGLQASLSGIVIFYLHPVFHVDTSWYF